MKYFFFFLISFKLGEFSESEQNNLPSIKNVYKVLLQIEVVKIFLNFQIATILFCFVCIVWFHWILQLNAMGNNKFMFGKRSQMQLFDLNIFEGNQIELNVYGLHITIHIHTLHHSDRGRTDALFLCRDYISGMFHQLDENLEGKLLNSFQFLQAKYWILPCVKYNVASVRWLDNFFDFF